MGTIANSRTLFRCYSNLGVTVGSERSSSWVDSCGSYPVITYKLQSIDIGNTVIWLHFFFRVGFIRIESLLRRTDFYPNYIKRDWKLFFRIDSDEFGFWNESEKIWLIPNEFQSKTFTGDIALFFVSLNDSEQFSTIGNSSWKVVQLTRKPCEM